ncbi:hypothetical protein LQ567_11010 [Niabella pedocola]|uniref:DUF4131 domain-containing protein n=1 Tax=Niabella pedocola TaxID=1752077 RepID=A0ABS8PTP6_9BACT|nr:hypothetical protein [Niabella pedocola]MCD2423291.1 hypothetical protein [Niabella pedocola]
MKNRGLIITTIVFFLLVNTNYYWEGKLGLFAFPAFLLLVAVYLGLTIALLRQLYLLIKEKFRQKKRLLVIGLLTTVLLLIYFKPLGLVDFDKLEGNDVLVAEREGSANCLTTLKLKDDFTFRERIGCFGVSEIKGTFRVVEDTIYFDNVQPGRSGDHFYKFAVIKAAKFDNSKILGDLIRYNDITDTIGHELWITKNELQKLNDKSRTGNRRGMLADE